MLVRRDFGYILNGDGYSVSTSRHQSHCRGIATIVIPFSALRSASIDYRTFKLIDKSEQRIDAREYKDKDGNIKTIEERRPESCVIESNGKYYLSSMDNQRYFISELPHKCKTCQQAFDMLIPQQVKGLEYQRQGEWFVIPANIPNAKDTYNKMTKNYILPHKDNGNPHIATRGMFINKKHYISGQLRHPEHKMLHLSTSDNPKIYQAFVNTAKNSWSAGGRVD